MDGGGGRVGKIEIRREIKEHAMEKAAGQGVATIILQELRERGKIED